VNGRRFITERRDRWEDLEGLTLKAKGRPERLGAKGVLRLGRLYRQVAADLAQARLHLPGDPVLDRLEAIVARSRQLVYRTPRRELSFVDFVVRGYWWEVRRRPRPLLWAALMLFVPMVVTGYWAHAHPDQALGYVMFDPDASGPTTASGPLGLTVGEQANFAATIFTNNIGVALTTFAGGITGGLGSAVVLIFNGTLGTLAGLMVRLGRGDRFFELVAPHGVLELSLIMVAGAAGLRLGWAVVEPGTDTRLDALAAEARRAALILGGTSIWLVIAGLVEGFVTPRGLGLWPAVGFGFVLGAAYWALVFVLGRPPPSGSRQPDPGP